MSTRQKKSPMGGSAANGVSLAIEPKGVVLPSRKRADHFLRIATLSWNLAWGQEPVQSSHAHVGNALDPVAHDIGGHGRLLGHRQITGAGANDGDGSGTLR